MRIPPLSPAAEARVQAALHQTDWYAISNTPERTTRYRERREELEAAERAQAAAEPPVVLSPPPAEYLARLQTLPPIKRLNDWRPYAEQRRRMGGRGDGQ